MNTHTTNLASLVFATEPPTAQTRENGEIPLYISFSSIWVGLVVSKLLNI